MCIFQLAIEFANRFPNACGIIQSDFDMGDLLTGSYCASDLSRLFLEIYNMLQIGHFSLKE